ncbi:histidine kinase [Cohnella sp. GCM10027633]|uniref:sensor histidine kinase n=1 Tax=unclassified Cohnella TaxID=2636738 RepID=UPI00363CB342
MIRTRARALISRLVWLALCIGVLSMLLPSVFMRDQPYISEGRQATVALLKHWEVRYADGPKADGSWRPFDEAEWSKLTDYVGTLTLRRTLPELKHAQPYLFMAGMNRFEILIDGKSVYRYGMDGGLVWNNYRLNVHPLKLEPSDAGKTIVVRAKWEGLPFLQWAWMNVSDPGTRLETYLSGEWPLYAISLLNLIAGIVGAVLYVRRKMRIYAWFSALALTAGFGMLFLCISLQWFADVGSLYYWNDLLLPFGVYAFVGLYGEALGAARRMPIRLAKSALLLFTAANLCVGIWSPSLYWDMFVRVFPILGVAAMTVVTFVLFKHRTERDQAAERQWLVRGYAIMTVCGVLHMIQMSPPQVIRELGEVWPYAMQVLGGMLPNGLLLFMLSMVMVLVNSVRRVHQESERNAQALIAKNAELALFHRNLEQLVDVRTRELEAANRSLQETMREKAETLAEVSVLEERTRIAHEMHDVVGHTLTAAIVQLEATKKLAERDREIPLDKLSTVNGLIRKGLDDIRRTVRVLKMDQTPFKLEPALRDLIRDTEATMEVEVDAVIKLPPGLGKLAEQVLFHALQEGLTNGIRHGRCGRFRFTLLPIGDNLRFTLWNDGMPYGESKPGFGLTSMMERIHLIGGSVSIGSGTDLSGSPIGCELSITLPLGARGERADREEDGGDGGDGRGEAV